MKIRWKILLAILLLIIVCNSFFTAFLIQNYKSKKMEVLKNNIERTNEVLKVINVGALWDVDTDKLKSNLEIIFQSPEIYSLRLRDVTGTIDIKLKKDIDVSKAGLISHSFPVEKESFRAGTIDVQYTTHYLQKSLNNRKIEMIALTAILIFVTGILLFIITLKSLKPIDKIVNALALVHKRDFDISLNLNTKDEFKKIEDYFNEMTSTIKNEIETRKVRENQLIKSESRYKTIFNLVSVSILEIDYLKLTKRIQSLGEGTDIDLTEYLDKNPDILMNILYDINILNVNGECLRMFKADDLEDIKQNLKQILEPGPLSPLKEIVLAISREKKQIEDVITLKDLNGEKLEVIIRIDAPKEGYDYNVLLVSMLDITKRREFERNLAQIQKMETIGNLAGGIAHDFNNFLNGISGYADLIKFDIEGGDLNPDRIMDKVDKIKESVFKSEKILNKLMTLSRKYEPSKITIDLNESMKSVISLCSSTFPKNIEISPTYYPEPAFADLDPILIEQILLNFFINAMHAMTIMRSPENQNLKGLLSCHLDKIYADKYFCEAHPDAAPEYYWIFRISDTGVGMDKKTQEKIFEPFFTTKDKGSGTGLGLSQVYNFVHESGGFVDVYSKPGEGTQINLYLSVSKKSRK